MRGYAKLLGIKFLTGLFIVGLILCIVGIIGTAIEESVSSVITILISLVCMAFSWGALNVPEPEILPFQENIKTNTEISLNSIDKLKIYYTLDGSDPKNGTLYDAPFVLENSCIVAARTKYGLKWSKIVNHEFTIEQNEMKLNEETVSPTESSLEGKNEDRLFEEADEYITKSKQEEIVESLNNETSESEKSETEREPFLMIIGESHTPNGAAEIVEVSDWERDIDFAIDNSTYNGGYKVYISYMLSSLFGNSAGTSEEIISEIHIAIDQNAISQWPEEDRVLSGKIVINAETDGSPSTATVAILVDGVEQYNSGEINCYSLDIEPFYIDINGKKEVIVRTVCVQSGNPFIFGIVSNE